MNWTIAQLNVTSKDDLSDVVIIAHWVLTDTQEGYFGSTYGSVELPPPSGDFTPYDELTQEQVLGWIWENGVNKNEQEATVQALIDAQINPPILTPPLPWSE